MELRASLEGAGQSAPTVHELDLTPENAARFVEAMEASKKATPYGAAVYVYEAEEYQGMRLFLTEDGKSGAALKPDGDMVSLFSPPGAKAGRALVELQIQNGGLKADAFDTVLPALYAPHGLRVVVRDQWSDAGADESWDKSVFKDYNNGEPDVVYMVYDPDYFDA